MNKKLLICLGFCFVFAFAKAQLKSAKNSKELKSIIAAAQPGDTLVMLDGEWKNAEIKFEAMGSPSQPIILKAQTQGAVKLTGNSNLSIGGDYLEVHGLWFDGGDTGGAHVIKFETNSTTPARYSRVSNCAITNVTLAHRDSTNYYVSLHGINNRVDHSSFIGKGNKGPTIAVRLKDSENNQHRIDHNYFGERQELGTNGGETIRIGTSTYSKTSSRTVVEHNFFEKCNGEIEIVSVKSANNIIRNNLFLESEGTITLRHGDYNVVEGNVFIGNNNPKTGGIRAINKGHLIQNNIMIGVAGTGYRAPLSIMMGIPDGPLNGYDPVIDVIIQNNTVINSGPVALSIGTRENATVAPATTTFANNLIYNADRGLAIEKSGDISGIIFKGNKINPLLIADYAGVEKAIFKMEAANNILVPTKDSDEALSGVPSSPKARTDATGALRSNLRVGAVVPGNFKMPLAMSEEFGTSFLKISEMRQQVEKPTASVIEVLPGSNTLEKAIKKATGPLTLILMEGDYGIEKGVKVSFDLTIKGAGRDKTIFKVSTEAEKAPQYFFRMEAAAKLSINGVTMDAGFDKEFVKYAVSSPSEGQSLVYKLNLDDLILKNFKDESGAIFKAYKGTMADSVVITNSVLENSFRGLNLSYEKEGDGSYNAQHLIIKNTVFRNIEQYALHFLKVGSSSGGTGGNVLIDHCVFYNVDNNEKGRIVHVDGIENVLITNSIIDASPSTKSIVHLEGSKQIIVSTTINNSSRIKLSRNAIEKDVEYQDPKWESLKMFTLKSNSPLRSAGTDGKDIGLTH